MKNHGDTESQKENDNSPATKLKVMEDWNLSLKNQKRCFEEIWWAARKLRQYNKLRNEINEEEYFTKDIEILKKSQTFWNRRTQ